MPIRLIVVDDHPVVRTGVRAMLDDGDIEIVGEFDSTETAIRKTKKLKADVWLVDIRLPGKDGLACLTQLRERDDKTPVVMFSGYDNPTFMARASALGAVGYLQKTATKKDLLAAVTKAAGGESCWSRDELRRISGSVHVERIADDIEAPLTRREQQVLKPLALGLTNKEIAKALGIGYETVKEHVQHIMRKAGVNDRTQLAVWAVRRGLV